MNTSPFRIKNYPYLSSIMLMTTRACNLSCVYCVYDKARPAMDTKTLRKAIDLLFTAETESVRLQFFGGEPLLRMDLMLESIAYAETLKARTGKNAEYTVTTNVLLLDQEKLDILEPYGVDYLVSFDGNLATQAAQRPLSAKGRGYPYEICLDNIRRLVDRGCDFFVNMVVAPERAASIYDDARAMLALGVPRLRFAYQMGSLWGELQARAYFQAIERLLLEIKAENRPFAAINPLCMDEPDIMSNTPKVDCDGSVYLGCSIPALEMILPRLVPATRVGTVGSVRRMQDLKADREALWNKLLAVYADEPQAQAIVRSNLQMGLLSDSFFDVMKHRGLTQVGGMTGRGRIAAAGGRLA